MSTYAMQQAIFDHLRVLGRGPSDRAAGTVPTEGYQLTDDEARALREGDVGAFHTAGVHPVLINMFCRANGWKRSDYRVLFPAEAAPATGRVRWRRS